jgi:hypothetical protein
MSCGGLVYLALARAYKTIYDGRLVTTLRLHLACPYPCYLSTPQEAYIHRRACSIHQDILFLQPTWVSTNGCEYGD